MLLWNIRYISLIPFLYSGEWLINFISFIDSPISIKIEMDNDNFKNIVSFSSERSFLLGETVQIAVSLESNQIIEKHINVDTSK